MPRLYVVFDTNVYRTLGRERFSQIRASERSRSVLGMASYWVIHELVAHLATPEDPALSASTAALRRLADHCSYYDGSRTVLRLLGDTQDHLDEILFRLPPTHNEAEAYGQLVLRIANATGPGGWSESQRSIEDIATNVAQTEMAWVERLSSIVAAVNAKAGSSGGVQNIPGLSHAIAELIESEDGMRKAAEMMVRSAAARRELELSVVAESELVEHMLTVFPFQLRLYNAVAAHAVRDRVDMSGHANRNWIWDWMVAFSTSVLAYIDGAPIWLVTDDALILRAASTAGASAVVRGLGEYESILSLSPREFAEVVSLSA